MKNLFTGCVILLAALFTASCSHNGRTTAKRTIIDGKIANLQIAPDNNKFTLKVGDFGGNTTTYTTIVNEDGSFKIYFDQYIAQDVTITPLIRNFIAHPGDSIHIDVDYKRIGDVAFSGDGEKTNTDLYHYTSEYYSNYDDGQEKLYFKAMDTANYRAVCENMKAEMLKKRGEFIDKYQPNDEVTSWTKNYINTLYYTKLLSFYNIYNNILIRKNTGSAPVQLKKLIVPDEDLNEIYNTNLLNADSYNLLGYLMPRSNIKIAKHDYDGFIKLEAAQIEKTNRSPLIKQLLVGWLFHYQLINNNNTDDFEKNQVLFDSEIKAAFIKQPLNNYYNAVKNNIANPKKGSDAILKNTAGTPAKNIIDSIKNKYKGKVVYINFWATWCGPCIGEMPAAKKLEEKFSGKDVVFVNICLDSPKDIWQADVKKFNLTGPQLYFDSKQSGRIRFGLNINGIPHHILMDKNGDITESSVLLRPGLLTEHKINTLLDQPVSNPDPNNDGFKTINVDRIK